jgi:hypothetical protein
MRNTFWGKIRSLVAGRLDQAGSRRRSFGPVRTGDLESVKNKVRKGGIFFDHEKRPSTDHV